MTDVTPGEEWRYEVFPYVPLSTKRNRMAPIDDDVTPQPDADREERYRMAVIEGADSVRDNAEIWEFDDAVIATVMAVVDAEQAPLHARIRELEAEVERQAVLLRAINDCHLDPARAILQADKIAGAAILDRMKAEHVLARVEAHLAHLSGHPFVDHRAYVEALAAALAGTNTPAAPEASHTCPLCGLAGGHVVQETPKWVDLLGADPDFTDGKPVGEWLEEHRGEA